jgi:hypothetical protein
MLTLMGLATFVPCVVLPEWREYQALDMEAQIGQHRLEVLRDQVDRERRLLDALRSDPAVIARLAQRELGFQRADSQAVPVSSTSASRSEEEELFTPQPPKPPQSVARVVSWLPDFDYDRVFCDDETRPMVIWLSIGLIAVALGLSGRR